MHRIAVAMVALAGCIPDFETVDEACKDPAPGDQHASEEGAAAVARINCYRRFVQLTRARVDPLVTAANDSHLGYLINNDVVTGAAYDDFYEYDSTLPGYTGYDVFERLDHTGYEFPDPLAAGVQELYFYADISGAELVDRVFHVPWVRDIFYQPQVDASAWAERPWFDNTRLGIFTVTYRFPSQTRVYSPIAYPKNGQLDVPTTYTAIGAYLLGDVKVDGREVGYPITVTIGSDYASPIENPYSLVADSTSIVGPLGEVEHVQLPVDHATLTLVPLEPYEPGQIYDVEVEMHWQGVERKRMSWWFETGAVFDPTADGLQP